MNEREKERDLHFYFRLALLVSLCGIEHVNTILECRLDDFLRIVRSVKVDTGICLKRSYLDRVTNNSTSIG